MIMGRTLVCGDIHGGLKALQQCLDRAKVTPEDKLIFLGDYVDGWSESFEVVEKLLTLKSSNECVFLRGNHDIWLQEYLNTGYGLKNTLWMMNGGAITVDSYIKNQGMINKEHKNFFNTLLNWYITEDSIFVHAGWDYNNSTQ